MSAPEKEAIERFYCTLVDMDDSEDGPSDDARVLLPVGDVRAIIRAHNRRKAELDTLRAERDALAARVERLKAVLHGAEYPDVGALMEMPVEDCFKVGRMVAELSKGLAARVALSAAQEGTR
jgi:hypothetical protein